MHAVGDGSTLAAGCKLSAAEVLPLTLRLWLTVLHANWCQPGTREAEGLPRMAWSGCRIWLPKKASQIQKPRQNVPTLTIASFAHQHGGAPPVTASQAVQQWV